MQKGIFTGRFQPFFGKHHGIVDSILKTHPYLDLTIGVADWQGAQTRENFLTGQEAVQVAALTLADHGLEIPVIPIPVFPNQGLQKGLKHVIDEGGFTSLFSGSGKTLAAASGLVGHIVQLPDDDLSGPRARHIREALMQGTNDWQRYLTPRVVDFFTQQDIATRIHYLPEGEKRPWAIKVETDATPYDEGEEISTTFSRDRR